MKKIIMKVNPQGNSSPKKEGINQSYKILPSPNQIINEPIFNVPYDPKTCNQKVLEDLIPESLSNVLSNDQNKHDVDFYIENKPSLIIFESFSSILPSNMDEPYSDFSSWVYNLKFKETIYTNKDKELVVNCYECEGGIKYMIKKCWHYFDDQKQNENTISEIDSFLRDQFNEYSIMKIINGSPNSVQPIQFHIIYVPKIKYIATELLMPFWRNPSS